MPFGLKNAGATYQRLVDKMFKEQIRCTMGVSINDMLVKSLKADVIPQEKLELLILFLLPLINKLIDNNYRENCMWNNLKMYIVMK